MEGIDTYAEVVKEKMEERLGDGYEVRVQKVTKNNGIVLTGISIRKDGEHISPNIYLDDYYKKHLDAALDEITKVYENSPSLDSDMEWIRSWDGVKDKVCYRLINTEKNGGILKMHPHREFMDLSAVYVISLNVGGQNGSIAITDEMASNWGVSEEELWDEAFVNTQKLFPAKITGMTGLLESMGCPLGDDIPDDLPMLVATNEANTNGAGVIFYDDVLTQLTDRLGEKIFILPSSVHEVIAIADDGGHEAAELLEMVKEINRTSVEENEVLSDSVYRYERGGEIAVAE